MGKWTATKIAKELDISRSYLYYLKENGIVEVPVSPDGKLLWTQETLQQARAYLERTREEPEPPAKPPYPTIQISNRRYLGNKYKLIPFIQRVVRENCRGIHTVADIFAGTGAVASAFADKKLTTNDLMYSSYICNYAWFGAEPFSKEKLGEYLLRYNALSVEEENYMTQNFADTYFSRKDCAKIGFIREDIEREYQSGKLNARERALLITSLLYAMDRIANTCGHYDAFRQGAAFERPLELGMPLASNRNNPNNRCLQMDANELVRTLEADLVYIDPPYNSRQYCDAYHLLENVASWKKPEVYGVGRKMDRSGLKSDYCTRSAAQAFADLIAHTRAKYILFSYNNMAEKGNDRSNAKISDGDIFHILEKKGRVTVFSEEYRSFTTGKSDIRGNQERLFLCECADWKGEEIPSPLNYVGGKYKLLPQLLPHFPEGIDCFVDLFCGGCNVGINAGCSRVLFYDKSGPLIGLYRTFQQLGKEQVFAEIHRIIDQYGLSRSWEKGYAYYGCDSASGLGSYNKRPYLRLREDFNSQKGGSPLSYLQLYVLIVYGFNNQIRFNRSGGFNLPVGKRDFNSRMQRKLSDFIDRLQNGDYTFGCLDFRSLDLDALPGGSFLYADPPYLITCASYNEQDGWNEQAERDLLAFLDRADQKGIPFALSNVLRSKGKENRLLLEWLKRNAGRYRVEHLQYHYANSNYQTKDRSKNTEEVLILNR